MTEEPRYAGQSWFASAAFFQIYGLNWPTFTTWKQARISGNPIRGSRQLWGRSGVNSNQSPDSAPCTIPDPKNREARNPGLLSAIRLHLKRVNDKGDRFAVLTERGIRKSLNVGGHTSRHVGIHMFVDRAANERDLLQMTRDTFGAVAEQPCSGIC